VCIRKKEYNKVLESMQQDTVRSTLGNKTAFLINASTKGLQKALIDYQNQGVTRLETTP